MTVMQLIKSSLRLAKVLDSNNIPDTEMMIDALESFQTMVDGWSSEGLMVFSTTREDLALGTSASYTIGTGGTFNTVRPEQILGAYVSQGGVDYPVDITDAAKYRDIGNKGLSGIPSSLYYNPTYPLGTIYLAPVPSGGGTLHIDSLKPLTEPATLNTALSFPPGYKRAFKFNLAVELAGEYGIPLTPEIVALATHTLDRIQSKNAAARVETVNLEILSLNRSYSIDGG
jgi:hypothetical protein